MEQGKLVSITISLPKFYRDPLKRMAAEASLNNPDEFMCISQLGREIQCEHLSNLIGRKGKKESESID